MQETTNLKLKKPDYSDVADIADINANMDILDSQVHKNTTSITNINSNKADKTHNHNNGADLKNVNALTLGGKSVSDFAACGVISNGDFNNVTNAGLYTMRSCANAPDGGSYYGLLVVKSDTGHYIEQMAFKENSRKVFIRYCYGEDWYDWEEIGSKQAEKLRIFDVDGKTLKPTDGTNDLAGITPKQVTENEARLTGFNTNKYWFNFGIPNQTLKVPYSDLAIRALSFGKGAIPADTGMVRNVEGISDSVMNDPLFPVGYITRTHMSPYSPVNGKEFHVMYFPSTQAYGTQIAISEQAFDGKADSYDNKDNSGKGLSFYIRSGQEKRFVSEDDRNEFRELGYTVTTDPSDNSKYMAADWSAWVKINTTSQIYQQAFSVSNSSTNRSLSFSEKNLDTVIKDIYQRILGITSYTHPTAAGYKHIPSGGSSGQILKWSAAGTAQWANESGYTHPTTSGYKHIPTGGSSNQILKWSSDGTAKWAAETTYTHPTAAGYKHIPTGGDTYDALKYGGSSGTAGWHINPVTTFSKQNVSLTSNQYVHIAKSVYRITCPASAMFTVTAYGSTEDKRNHQTLVFQLFSSGGYGTVGIKVLSNMLQKNNDSFNGFFSEIAFQSLNDEHIFLKCLYSVSNVTLDVVSVTSLSGGKMGFAAEYKACASEDSCFTGSHHYFKKTISADNYVNSIKSSAVGLTAGSSSLLTGDVIMVYE